MYCQSWWKHAQLTMRCGSKICRYSILIMDSRIGVSVLHYVEVRSTIRACPCSIPNPLCSKLERSACHVSVDRPCECREVEECQHAHWMVSNRRPYTNNYRHVKRESVATVTGNIISFSHFRTVRTADLGITHRKGPNFSCNVSISLPVI